MTSRIVQCPTLAEREFMAQQADGEIMIEAVTALSFSTLDNPELGAGGWHSEPQDIDWTFGHRAFEQTATALAFIDAAMRMSSTRLSYHNSYSLKHCAERWGKRNGMEPYVSNGAFIAAAIYRGLAVERWDGSLNCGIAISGRALEKLRCFDA